jgi:hypothetical protein
MAAQSLLAKLGVRSATLGTEVSIAIAFPLTEGAQGMDAHTAGSRTGWYAVTGTKIGNVVNGVEVLTVGASTILSLVPLSTPASTTAAAGLNIGQGAAPTAPNNGDMWITSAGLFVYAGGITYGPFAPTSNVQTFTAGGGTWTKPTGAQDIVGVIISHGGAGGSGLAVSAANSGTAGGSGGGSSGVTPFNIPAASLPGSVTVSVPATPTGYAGTSIAAAAGTSAGLPPSSVAGSACSFGTYAVALGGSSGLGATSGGGQAGGAAGTGMFAGAAGAAGTGFTASTTPGQPATSVAGPGSGGGGGGAASSVMGNGGAGGNLPRSGGATGGGTGGIANGALPGTPTSQPAGSGLPGAGGGGGGSMGGPGNVSAPTGQSGANGGSYGAGGGGGGGGYDDAATFGATGGSGGNGGPAIVIVITLF